jgi:hypothetical protein
MSPPALEAIIFGGFSSAGRAPALQAGGQRFEPVKLHHIFRLGYKVGIVNFSRDEDNSFRCVTAVDGGFAAVL